MQQTACERGFSLVQISIVLTVAALVLVTVLPTAQTSLTANKNAKTQLNAVLASLRNYEAANGDLPCPADGSLPIGSANYGVAAANSGPYIASANSNCTGSPPAANYTDSTNNIAIGVIPVRTLGLPVDSALDAYGRHITYAVDTNATQCGWTSTALTGNLSILNNGFPVNTVAALISHGADGHGAWIPLPGAAGTAVRLNISSTDTDELTNAHVDTSFTPTTTLTNFVSKMPTATFDDLLAFNSPLWNLNQLPQNAPYVVSISAPSGDYESVLSQVISFTVTYSAPVTVTGTPRLIVNINGTTRYPVYASGSGTASIVFNYTVVNSDYAPAPTGISVTGYTPNGGSIKSGTYCVPFNSQTTLANVYVNAGMLIIGDFQNHRYRKVSISSGIISVYAGTGVSAYGGDGGPAASATFVAPSGNIWQDTSGNVYLGDQGGYRVRKVTLATGLVSTVAGSGVSGFAGDGGPATSAKLGSISGLVTDTAGNLYITETTNYRIRKVQADNGIISTYAGTGAAGPSGDGGAATSAAMSPITPSMDSANNLYFGDHYVIREILSGTGIVNTVAGTGSSGYSGDGGPATSAKMVGPGNTAFDNAGNFYIADNAGFRLRKVNLATGIITTIAGTGVSGSTGDGGLATSATFKSLRGLVVDVAGNIYIDDKLAFRIRKITASTGIISTFAGTGVTGNGGDGGPATSAQFAGSEGMGFAVVR